MTKQTSVAADVRDPGIAQDREQPRVHELMAQATERRYLRPDDLDADDALDLLAPRHPEHRISGSKADDDPVAGAG